VKIAEAFCMPLVFYDLHQHGKPIKICLPSNGLCFFLIQLQFDAYAQFAGKYPGKISR